MAWSKLILFVLLLSLKCVEQAEIQCSGSFSANNNTNLCYYYKSNMLSWSDAYNQCLTKTVDGLLIQIFSEEQFLLLQQTNINDKSIFWIGANNFASFRDSKWHWLDGSVVDDSTVTWCPNSTYETAIGTYCAAYDSRLQCVNNYLCSSLFSAPCVSGANGINRQAKGNIIAKQTSDSLCTSSFGGTYANWWTYSVLLINWFLLFSFVLYLFNRFAPDKNTIAITAAILLLSLLMIIVFAALWGVQYQNIIQIPLVNVIIGCLAGFFLLIVVLIILNDRTRVQRLTTCRIVLGIVIIFEAFLMLGLILCIAYCSGYITLASTSLEKDVTASLLASLIAAISVLLNSGILYLLENPAYDRNLTVRPVTTNIVAITTQTAAASAHGHPPPLHQSNNNALTTAQRPTNISPVKKVEHTDRATSPVDDRILQEFYSDRPKDVHQYSLEGRQYVVFEGATFTDIDTYRKELTEAMLLQEPDGLHEAIKHAKGSIHASTLEEEIGQAENLASKLN
ncbi:unnamed protein product [Adineta ricciae]|uniref:C-type lectin domain-containing protein n=1 Tax=Adineta ricciae TaxID=249248 RepID=A0A816BEH8_ADIRI|nr:unnamed protein product [Adineta ricciae]